MLLTLTLLGQVPDQDSRNTNIPHTDTHFAAPACESLDKWEARKAELRRQILFAAGLEPMPERTPLNARVFGRLERDGYSIEKVALETMPGYYLGGNLYRPRGRPGPFPAIAKPHGHWTYGRLENQPLNSTQTLAANLALQGFAVFAYDMVGYNDTAQTPHRFGAKEQELWSFGPLGLQLWNSIRVVDFLQSLPDVDGNRIGATGASGGGTQTFLLAAVDERIQFAAPVNMVSAIMQGGCVCENAPGLRIGTSNVEIAAMMAPRPMLLVSATGDWTKNVPREEFPAIREFYRLYNMPDNVEVVQFDSPHNYHKESREAVYRFFAKHALHRQDAGALMEKNTAIEQLEDMLVWQGRPLPDNALDFEGVFAQWKAMAARQAGQIADDGAARGLLQLALKTKWPERVVSQVDGERIVLSRPSAGDRVSGIWIAGKGRPSLVVHPKGADAARKTDAAQRLLRAKRPVLLIDAFQTGAAVAERDLSVKHYFTFNRSDDANRVQDVATALAFLRAQGETGAELIGLEDAALWCLFAAAVAPGEVELRVDPAALRLSDAELAERFYIPGIQRAGGVETARRLAKPSPAE